MAVLIHTESRTSRGTRTVTVVEDYPMARIDIVRERTNTMVKGHDSEPPPRPTRPLQNKGKLMLLTELIDMWGGVCVICGEAFASIDCVSCEHLIPKSMGGGRQGNLAPSHYKCNMLRSSNSIIDAAMLVDRRRKRMSREQFLQWVNSPLPDLKPLVDKFGREKVNELRLSYDVNKKWPWWKLK